MAKPKITLYVDIVSPFAYMGYYMLRHHPIFANVDITYTPIFLGGLMNACDNRPPMAIKNKGKYINAERSRWAKRFNIPITPGVPAGFPLLTLTTMRALVYLQTKYPSDQQGLIRALDALYDAYWVHADNSVGTPEGLHRILAKALPGGAAEADEVITKGIASAEIKKKLVENTNESFSVGAFGLPWFHCTNSQGESEGFWGVDHLGQVIQFLGLDLGAQIGKDGRLKAFL